MTALMTDLKRLSSMRAPDGFAERVLIEVGMADSYARFGTVLGNVYVAWNRFGVSAAARSASAAEFEDWFGQDVGRPLVAAEPPADLAEKIADELNGKRTMRFDLRGLTEFEQAVLRKTYQIPRGEVRPYGWVAREIRRPAAVRAVGTALANNPIPYFIPCHRVVRTDGEIGNYGGGGYVYQADAHIPQFDGNYPILGSWYVIDQGACGMGVRESFSPITDNLSSFVPHFFT